MQRQMDDKVNVRVLRNGDVVRIRGSGMPRYKREGEYGDLMVHVNVVLPKLLPADVAEKLSALLKSVYVDEDKAATSK